MYRQFYLIKSQKPISIMNKQNAEFLEERLFFLGFGDKLNAVLEKNMKAGNEKFQIPFQGEFSKGDKKDVVEYQIDFSKSKQADMYFVNKYEATLGRSLLPDRA
jgi:hypothetical protein